MYCVKTKNMWYILSYVIVFPENCCRFVHFQFKEKRSTLFFPLDLNASSGVTEWNGLLRSGPWIWAVFFCFLWGFFWVWCFYSSFISSVWCSCSLPGQRTLSGRGSGGRTVRGVNLGCLFLRLRAFDVGLVCVRSWHDVPTFVIWPDSVRVWTKTRLRLHKKKQKNKGTNWKPAGVMCVFLLFRFCSPESVLRCHFPF